MRKILIFSLAYYPKHVGGAEVAIKQITDRIDKSDIEFHMINLHFDSTLPKVEQIGNVLVHRIGFSKENPTPEDMKRFPLHLNKYFYQLLAFWEAQKLHKKYHYDGLWGVMAHATAVPLALFSIFHPKVPCILTLQEGDDLKHIERMAYPVWPLFTRAFKKALIVQAISSYLGDWAKRMGAGNFVVIPNGVDTKQFQVTSDESERRRVRESLGAEASDTLVITTSRLVKKNAVDDCIAALGFLPKSVRLVVLGDGPLEKEMYALVETKGVKDRVSFLGRVEYENIPKYLHACDIFIRPSRTEGMGNSFIEAMATGLPVIATQEGGLRDFIFDEKLNPDKPTTAWAVPKDNPEAIAHAIEDVMANPEKVKRVAENALMHIQGRYEWDTVAKRMMQEVFIKV